MVSILSVLVLWQLSDVFPYLDTPCMYMPTLTPQTTPGRFGNTTNQQMCHSHHNPRGVVWNESPRGFLKLRSRVHV